MVARIPMIIISYLIHFTALRARFVYSPLLSSFLSHTKFQQRQILVAMATPTPEAVATFMRITGAPEFVAVQKLEEYGGNLNEAVNAHFLEGDNRHNQGQIHPAAAPQYNYSGADNQNQNRDGSRGIMPFFNAARRFRPSLLLDPNYRREIRDLCNGLGATTFSSSPQPHGSPQGVVRGAPAGFNSAPVSPYQSGFSSTSADMSGNLASRGQGVYGSGDYQNDYYPLAQSNTPSVRDQDIEEAMIQAAIEASKEGSRESSSRNAPNDLSDDGLPQSHFQREDDDLAHAMSLSLKTAEQEEAIRELLVKEEKEGLGVHDLSAKEKTNGSRSRPELGTSSNQNVVRDAAQPVTGNPWNHSAGGHHQVHEDMFIADKWGGISSDELNEALLIENSLFGGIPNHSPHNFSSLPDLQHHPEKIVDPKMRCSSSSTSQVLTETQMLRQQQDADYLASLQADKLKELNFLKEAEIRSSKEEESLKTLLERKELETMLDTKKVMLSKEPPLGDEKAITIVVRMPNGGRYERRFLKTDKLQLLFDFIDLYGEMKPGTYRVVKSYPRRAYSIDDTSATLNEVGLNNKNEALFLELI